MVSVPVACSPSGWAYSRAGIREKNHDFEAADPARRLLGGASSMPATPYVLEDTLARVHAPSWEEAVEVTCEDSRLILGSDAESCQRVTLL